MGKFKHNKKRPAVAEVEVEEDDFLNFSDDSDIESEEKSEMQVEHIRKKKAYQVDMSDTEIASEDDGSEDDEDDEDCDMEEEIDDDDNIDGVVSDEEKPRDRKDSRESSKFYAEQNQRTVFVGNITPLVTPKVLIQLFNSKKAAGPGAVETVRIRGAITQEESNNRNAKRRAIIQKKFKDEENQVLCAFVVLKKKEDVEKCLQLNNHLINGKKLRVDVINGKKMNYSSSNSVFIGNLPFDCNEEQVREAFEKCGGVNNVRLVRSKDDGKVKGFGYVEFSESMGVDFSLKMNGKITIGDRMVRVEKWTANQTQERKRKVPELKEAAKAGGKKRKIVVPTNMRSLELNEYVKSKNKKMNKKVIKKKAFLKDRKEKMKTHEK